MKQQYIDKLEALKAKTGWGSISYKESTAKGSWNCALREAQKIFIEMFKEEIPEESEVDTRALMLIKRALMSLKLPD